MTGYSIEIEFNDRGAGKELDMLIDKMARPSGFYKNVGEHIQAVTIDRFNAEQAPDGTPWKALAPVTLAARARRGTGTTIYRERGDFFGSLNYQASSDGFRWGSNDVRARIFQLGGKAGRGLSVTLPPRPYLGLSPDDENAILDIARDWLSIE
jgi:phage virion morphogenesis protein